MTSATDRQAQTMTTTTNLANLSRSAQSARGSVMKRARTFTMSLAFAAAVLTFLLTGAVTAQAQNNCYGQYGYFTACWANNDSGYIYKQINGRWHYMSYFKGASTNAIYTYDYASRQWSRPINKRTFNATIKLVVLLDELLARIATLPKPPVSSGDPVRDALNNPRLSDADKVTLISVTNRAGNIGASIWTAPNCVSSYNGCR